MSTHYFCKDGNDTIDRYPLCESGVLKILCITVPVWREICKAFEAFQRLINKSAIRKPRRQSLRLEPVIKPKINLCQAAYEPTCAIVLNDAGWRRWVRVKEWFCDIDGSLEKQSLRAAWNSILSGG